MSNTPFHPKPAQYARLMRPSVGIRKRKHRSGRYKGRPFHRSPQYVAAMEAFHDLGVLEARHRAVSYLGRGA